MSTYLLITPKEDELYHYGVKGQKRVVVVTRMKTVL